MPLIIALSLACFAGAYAIRVIDPIIPELVRSFGVTPAIAALLASAFSFPYALGQPVLGPIADAAGKALVLKIGLAVMCACLAVTAMAPSIEVMFVARALGGLAGGATIPVAMAIIGDRVAYANRQVALSQLLSAMLMAQFAGLVGTGLIASWFGWRIAIATATGVSALALIVTVFGLRPRKVVQRPPFRVATLRESYADVFANPRAVVCYTAVFVEGLAIFGLLPHVATMLEARGAGGIAEAGLVLACMGIGGLIFTLGVRRLLAQLGGMFNLMRVGGIVAALGFAGIAMQASWPFEAGAFLLVGLGFYAVHNSLQTLATELAPEHRGSSVALHAFFFFLGHAAGPPIYSLSFAAIGQAQTLLLVALTVFVGGFVLAAALKARSASAE